MAEFATAGEGFGYTEEEWILKHNLRKLLEEKVLPRQAEDYNKETHEQFIRDAMRLLGDEGYLRMATPEALGGYGMGLGTIMIIVEECARVSTSLAGHVDVACLIAGILGPLPEVWAEYGEDIISGKKLIMGSMTSPEGNSNWQEVPDIGKWDEENQEWVLNGEKTYSTGGDIADIINIMGLVDGSERTWVLDAKNTPGLTVHSHEHIGCGPTHGAFTLENVRVPASHSMPGGLGMVIDRKCRVNELHGLRTSTFDMPICLGFMDVAFEKTVEYLKNRTHNYKPIASITSIQVQLAEMKTKISAAHAMCRILTKHVESGHRDIPLWGSMAKVFINRVAREVAMECIQLHGNIGLDPKTGIFQYLNEAMAFSVGGGPKEEHLRSIANYMGLPDADFDCL